MTTTKKLAGKSALVTASSRGIGRATALRLAADGAQVAVNYHSDAASARAVVEAIESAGGRAIAVQGDIGVPADVERVFKETLAAFGSLDILVNNAGLGANGALAEVGPELLDRVVDVNFKGTFYAIQQAARVLNDGGRIVNISTGYTKQPFPGFGVYSATKAAVEALGLAASKELGARQITVNSVLPGLVNTDQTAPIREQFPAVAGMTPLGRVGEPEDIADVVAFLASDDARWVTGQIIAAAGGLA
ncbi:A-factor type gamma-butyrolactone 6-reductase ScbB [Kitasatospora putterlickiae]|uniref:A-factor type gamma-butyrolactone 6-reductase ScbB n=1 Tax=Kitasatospora putterlickiae TaxID=221725 RepID=A0ABN1XU92_9ACTN